MPNPRFEKGELVWCGSCRKHHVVKTDEVNPCPSFGTVPEDLPKAVRERIIADFRKRGYIFDNVTGKFIKPKGSKKVD